MSRNRTAVGREREREPNALRPAMRAALIAGLCGLGAANPGCAPRPVGAGRLNTVYAHRVNGDWEIYSGRTAGHRVEDAVRLTNSPGDDKRPVVSSDGRTVAFESKRDGDLEIYVMNADGSGQKRLTETPGLDREPAFSPNGRRIAFSSNRGGAGAIYVMNADGTEPKSLTPADGSTSPDYSPDGKRIAFARGGEIWTMDADGGHPQRLTKTLRQVGAQTERHSYPFFSPDGARVGFFVESLSPRKDETQTSTPRGEAETYAVNVDGTASAPLDRETFNEWAKRRRTARP